MRVAGNFDALDALDLGMGGGSGMLAGKHFFPELWTFQYFSLHISTTFGYYLNMFCMFYLHANILPKSTVSVLSSPAPVPSSLGAFQILPSSSEIP